MGAYRIIINVSFSTNHVWEDDNNIQYEASSFRFTTLFLAALSHLSSFPPPPPPSSVYPVVSLSVITSGSQTMLQCDAYGYPVLTEVTIVDTSSTSNIYTHDNYTSGGRATSTQQLLGCPTFKCRASNRFGMITAATATCTGMCMDWIEYMPISESLLPVSVTLHSQSSCACLCVQVRCIAKCNFYTFPIRVACFF